MVEGLQNFLMHMNPKGFAKVLLICLAVILIGIAIYFIFVQRTPGTPPLTPSTVSLRTPGTPPLTPSTVSLQDLQAAPERIVINGSEYTLETYLWRDFMPVSPPDGQPLVAVVKVKSPGETAVSSKIDATRLWVVKGKEIWETEFTNEQRSTVGDTLEKVGRNGPKWGPRITVDVIVKVIDLRNNKEYLLKAPNQDINRTD